MDLLVPCSDQPDCYVYTVRGAGPGPSGNGSDLPDTLSGIVRYFGVDVTTVREMNSWLGGSSDVTPGDKLKIPPPTR